MLNIPRSLLLVSPPPLLSYRAASANPSQAPSLPYHHLLHPPTLTPAQTTLSQPGAVAPEQRPGAIVEDVMREEMDRIARNISEQAVSLLTDQLLLFTMRGQRYLCLNAVRTLASKFDAPATCKVAVLITRQTDTT